MKRISETNLTDETILICTSCGSEDSIVSNGDCGGCTECYSIENYETAYIGNDGEVYLDADVDWLPPVNGERRYISVSHTPLAAPRIQTSCGLEQVFYNGTWFYNESNPWTVYYLKGLRDSDYPKGV